MSARSMISVFACGMSIPDSMMLVATSTSASPRRKRSIRGSSSVSSSCPWATSKRMPRAQPAQALGGLVDRLDPVVQEERLAAARMLALERLAHELLVVLADVCLHRAPALGRRLDHADVAHAGQRHLQRARDRRGAHRDHVDAQLELAQQLLLLDAEALLLVDDQQAEVLRPDVAAEQAMRADQDVDPALVERPDDLALLPGRAEAADDVDRERVVAQALGERAVVLLGEDRRRGEHEHLLAVVGGLERRAQRDLRLAVADVAADQAVHRLRGAPCRPSRTRSPRPGRPSPGTGTPSRSRSATRSPRGTRDRCAAGARRRG